MLDFILTHPIVSTLALLFAVVGLVEFLSFRIRPLFIPKAEINAIVDDLIQRYGPDAEHHASREEERAWRSTDTFEQGKWRRVRRELWRRYKAGEWE